MVSASALSGRSGLDVNACPVAKPSQHPHRVLPREAKGRHVRKAKPSDHVANDLEVRLVELAFVEGNMGPGEDCRWPESPGYLTWLSLQQFGKGKRDTGMLRFFVGRRDLLDQLHLDLTADGAGERHGVECAAT